MTPGLGIEPGTHWWKARIRSIYIQGILPGSELGKKHDETYGFWKGLRTLLWKQKRLVLELTSTHFRLIQPK